MLQESMETRPYRKESCALHHHRANPLGHARLDPDNGATSAVVEAARRHRSSAKHLGLRVPTDCPCRVRWSGARHAGASESVQPREVVRREPGLVERSTTVPLDRSTQRDAQTCSTSRGLAGSSICQAAAATSLPLAHSPRRTVDDRCAHRRGRCSCGVARRLRRFARIPLRSTVGHCVRSRCSCGCRLRPPAELWGRTALRPVEDSAHLQFAS
jgi:hypothetical protein